MQRKVTETWWTNGGISNHHLKLAKRHKYTNSNAVSTYASVACFELQTWTNNHRTLTKPSSGAWSRRRNQVAGKPKKDAARQCIAASCSRPYWRLEIFFRVNFGDTVHKLIYILIYIYICKDAKSLKFKWPILPHIVIIIHNSARAKKRVTWIF